jgi:hypothetical protein
MSFYVALTNVDLLDIIFQRAEVIFTLFHIDDFRFTFIGAEEGDTILYRVTYGNNFDITLTLFGVNSRDCGPDSNLDLVYFMWQHFERFGLRKHVITLLSLDVKTFSLPLMNLPLMRCLTDHRALSDGWRDSGNCDDCVVIYRDAIRDLCQCRAPTEECACEICRRQPPSLRLTALHKIRLMYNVERFQLTANTTYEEYVFAVMSDNARVANLLPIEYPMIRIWFRCGPVRFETKFHKECPGEGSWGPI